MAAVGGSKHQAGRAATVVALAVVTAVAGVAAAAAVEAAREEAVLAFQMDGICQMTWPKGDQS